MNQFPQPKILVVDDDELLCQLLCEELNEERFITDYVLNGIEALRKIKGDNYNLVILNFNMPGLRGDEVLSEIKKYDSSIPVIMLTGQSDPSFSEECIKLGANDYITKPYDYDELLSSIISYLK